MRLLSTDLLLLKLLRVEKQESTLEIETDRAKDGQAVNLEEINKQKLRHLIRMVLRLQLLEILAMELELVEEIMEPLLIKRLLIPAAIIKDLESLQ